MYTRISTRLSGNSKDFATCEIAFSHSINAMQRRQITDGSRKRKTLFLYFNAVIRIIMGAPRFTNPLPPACGPHLERLKPQLHIVSPYLTDPSTVRFRTYIFCILYVVLHSISTMDWKKITACEKILFEYRVYIPKPSNIAILLKTIKDNQNIDNISIIKNNKRYFK